jgi:hypothetical protein
MDIAPEAALLLRLNAATALTHLAVVVVFPNPRNLI